MGLPTLLVKTGLTGCGYFLQYFSQYFSIIFLNTNGIYSIMIKSIVFKVGPIFMKYKKKNMELKNLQPKTHINLQTVNLLI